MKKALFFFLFLSLTTNYLLNRENSHLRREGTRLRNNQTALLDSCERYITRDSLSVVRAHQLEITNKELRKHLQEDARLIETLKMKGRDVQGMTTTSSATKYDIVATVRDTIIRKDTIDVYVQCMNYNDPWLDFNGCVEAGQFNGEICSRDTIHIVESVKYKRFLGFLWKTKKVKDRSVDVLSRNPHADISISRSFIVY